ncbi:DUF1450 domain-containing protein [Halalkalibacter alkalisediminis]|uniref:DUF1450 domain-containing protein n=1 Tax=Halalkalibacter alkalisediminis TaxID=935616 RepID=A0ABV6NLC3_9BACI|nr:DUF1450 domain-containing protein [Halalkalibacter alkalisediminis]
MKHAVKFCSNNFNNELQKVKSDLKNSPNIDVIEDECLNYCGQCFVQPFSLINGKNITCDAVNELYANIIEYIETSQVNCSSPKLYK